MAHFNQTSNYLANADTFPGLIGELFRGLTHCGHLPEIVGPALSVMVKLATQDLADLQYGSHSPQPIGVDALIAAPSGSGKSTLLNKLRFPFDQFDLEHVHIAAEAAVKRKHSHRVWATKVKAIENKLNKSLEDPDRLQVFQEMLALTLAEEPKVEATPSVICHDATIEGLLKKLQRWPSAGIILDEARLWLKNRVAKNPAEFIKLMDGSPYRINRAGTGEIFIPAPRLAILLMIQNGVFVSFRRDHEKTAQESGFDARFLFSVVEQQVPTTYRSDFPADDVLQAYGRRVTSLLQQSARPDRQGPGDRYILTLSDAALRFLEDQNAHIQHQRRGWPAAMDAYAARHVERVAKMAASWTVFNDCTGPISLDYVQRANVLCLHHLEIYRAYLATSVKASSTAADAQLLDSQLRTLRYLDPAKGSVFKINVIRKLAKNWGLDKKRFDLAFDLLCREARIQVIAQGGGNFFQLAMQRSQLLPEFFPQLVWA